MTAYTTAVLRCDHPDCTAALEGDSVSDCRKQAKAAHWRRVIIDSLWDEVVEVFERHGFKVEGGFDVPFGVDLRGPDNPSSPPLEDPR